MQLFFFLLFFFSQFTAFLALSPSNYSLFRASDKTAPGRKISQHFYLGLVHIPIPYDPFVYLLWCAEDR